MDADVCTTNLANDLTPRVLSDCGRRIANLPQTNWTEPNSFRVVTGAKTTTYRTSDVSCVWSYGVGASFQAIRCPAPALIFLVTG